MKKKKYLVINSCYYYPYKRGKRRSKHYFEVVDLETGELKQIKNGAIIKMIKGKIEDAE